MQLPSILLLVLAAFVAESSGAPPTLATPAPHRHHGADHLSGCTLVTEPPTKGQPAVPRGTFAATTVIDNGPSSNRVDIVLLGDGYTAAELGDYANDVDNVLAGLFLDEPFAAYAGYFNVHRVDVISTESGVDEPDQGIFKITALDMSYGINTTSLTLSTAKAISAAANAPAVDQILAMANSSRYGGSGYYFSEIGTFPGQSGAAVDIALHEFGHSFGNLADEYVNNTGPYPFAEPWEANVSTLDAAAQATAMSKWYRWLDEPDVGTFEGARYYQTGIYRSSASSKMRAISSPFRQVNVEQFVRLIYETVSPINDATPLSATPLLAGTSFFVTPMQPVGHSLDIQWSVDGIPVAGENGNNFTPDYASLADGIHTVAVTVIDNTTRVRDEDLRATLMTGTRSWPVQGSSPGAPTNLVATAAAASVQLDWDDNQEPDLVGYNVHRSTSIGGPYAFLATSSTSDYLDTAVTAATTYYYVVTAFSAVHESGDSNEDFGTPGVPPPANPSGILATPGENEVQLEWNDNPEPNIAGYHVYRATTTGGPYTRVNTTLVAPSDYLDTGLLNDTTYYFVVVARDTGGNESGFSSEATATPLDLPPAAPANLMATAGDATAHVDWDDNSEPDFQEYRVYQSLTSGGPYIEIDSDTPSEWFFTGLINGTPYYWVVTAVDEAGNESAYSNEATATPQNTEPPAPPANLTAVGGFESVQLDWDDSPESDFAHYTIYRALVSGGPYLEIDSDDPSEWFDGGLTNGTTYYYVVTAVDTASNESAVSNEASATATSDPPPSPPVGLSATGSDGSVSLNWIDSGEPDLSGYNVHRATNAGGPYTKINGSLVLVSDFFDDTVTNSVTYYYVVTAVDGAMQESGFSSEASATPQEMNPPAPPTGVVALAMDGGAFLDWNDNTEPDFQEYLIYQSATSGGPYEEVDSDNPSEFFIFGLSNGITYYWVVTAVDELGNESGFSNEASTTPVVDPPPLPPRDLTAVGLDGQVSLDWTTNVDPDLACYVIYRATTSGGPYTEIERDTPSDYVDNTVVNGTTYYYVVTATDTAMQESAASAEVSATPQAGLTPPDNVSATAAASSVTISWDMHPNPQVIGYGIYRAEVSGGPYSPITSTQNTSTVDATVISGTTYYYVVTSIDSTQNESGFSAEVAATPGNPIVLGDLDCSGALDMDDVSGMVLALVDPAGYPLAYPTCDLSRGDLNGNGLTNGDDLQLFVEALVNSGP